MIHKRSKAAYGASLAVVSSLFYGSYGVWTKLMGDGFGSYLQAGLRSLLVVAYLLPLALWHKQLTRVQWRRDARWLVLLMVASSFTLAPVYYATLHIGVGLATALCYVAIVLGMFFFGWLLGGEWYTKEKLVSTILGIGGIWLIFSPTIQSLGLLPLGAALLSGFAIALDVVITQRLSYNATQSTILTWSAGALATLPIAFLLGQKVPVLSIHWAYLFLFAAVSLVSSWTVIRASKLISAGAVGILGLLEIVFGVLFGVVFFDERPGIMVLVGMAMIVAAAAIPYVQHFSVKDEPFELSEPKTKEEER